LVVMKNSNRGTKGYSRRDHSKKGGNNMKRLAGVGPIDPSLEGTKSQGTGGIREKKGTFLWRGHLSGETWGSKTRASLQINTSKGRAGGGTDTVWKKNRKSTMEHRTAKTREFPKPLHRGRSRVTAIKDRKGRWHNDFLTIGRKRGFKEKQKKPRGGPGAKGGGEKINSNQKTGELCKTLKEKGKGASRGWRVHEQGSKKTLWMIEGPQSDHKYTHDCRGRSKKMCGGKSAQKETQ